MGDHELLAYVSAGMTALMTFAWKLAKMWLSLRRDELNARVKRDDRALTAEDTQTRAMIELRNKVEVFIAFQQQTVYRPKDPASGD